MSDGGQSLDIGVKDSADYRAQSTVDFPIGGHVNVLSDYKETGSENKKISSKKHVSGSLKMHARVLPLNIDQTEHAILHPQGHARINC